MTIDELRDRLSRMPVGERRVYLEGLLRSNPGLADQLRSQVQSRGRMNPFSGIARQGIGAGLRRGGRSILNGFRSGSVPVGSVGPNSGIAATPGLADAGFASNPGWVGSVNAAAPWLLGGLAGVKLVQGLTAPSAKERFNPMVQMGASLRAAGKPRPSSFAIPSSSQLFRQAGYDTKGKIPEYSDGRPGESKVYTSQNKPFVLLTDTDPVGSMLKSGDIRMGGVSFNPAGRVGVSANQYSNLVGAATHARLARESAERGR